jgi:hypothetical protein
MARSRTTKTSAAKTETPGTPRRNLRLEWVDPKTLSPNPKNWRRHPKVQVDALGGLIKRGVGWAGALLYNERTGRLIDGHARRNLDVDEVPVLIGSWTEEEENTILATLDPLAEAAEVDEKALAVLIADMKIDDPSVNKLFERMMEENAHLMDEVQKIIDRDSDAYYESEDNTMVDDLEDSTEISEAPAIFFRPDAIFASSNKWGIPDLKTELLSTVIPTEVHGGESYEQVKDPSKWLFIHGKAKFTRENVEGGVLCFYLEDESFDSIWNNIPATVEKLYRTKWGGVVTPDFSVWADDPLAVQIWNVYRARWCARYWQDAGIKVLPNVSWADKRSFDFAFEGIPKNAPVVICQCRSLGKTKTDKEFGRKRWITGFTAAMKALEPQNVLIYGGIEHRGWIESLLPKIKLPKIHYLDSWIAKRRAANFRLGEGYPS